MSGARPKSPERQALEQRIAALWRAGKSASVIEEELGRVISRNGILGVIHRNGWSGGAGRAHAAGKPRPKPAARLERTKPAPARPPVLRFVPPSEPPPLPPTARMLALEALVPGSCRFPIGEPGRAGFGFCGADGADFPDRPYCAYHARLTRQSPSERQQRTLKAIAAGERLAQ